MQRLRAVIVATVLLLAAGAVTTDRPASPLEAGAEALAASLATACPATRPGSDAAFDACGRGLRTTKLPFDKDVAWGGDQPDKPVNKKALTHLSSRVFQTMYLPLFGFTGRWSLGEDKLSHVPIIRIEAYFRNALAAGDYPYPFWHSADKWGAYEAANELRFYLDPNGQAIIVTRDGAGNEDRRGAYAHVDAPVFDGAWQWRDASGSQQPRVSLFGAQYRADNPVLASLDRTYRSLALRMRDESCLDCHTPANRAKASRLVLLQTPRHAAGEIDSVIAAIGRGEMPQDDIGLREEIPAERRAMLLDAAVAFRDELRLADQWEASRAK